MWGEEIFASDVQDHALTDLIALAEVLDQAEVFVAAVGGLDGSEEHRASKLHYKNATTSPGKQDKCV